MGDMKTPDFDDLLAAFDIPDMVDPKSAIESGDHESQVKPTHSTTTPQDDLQSIQDTGISVIVKNSRNKENKGHLHSQTHVAVSQNRHHNGYLSTIPSVSYDHNTKWRPPNVNGTESHMFNKFSPISSAGELEEEDKVEDRGDKHGCESPNGSPNKLSDSLLSDDNLTRTNAQGNAKYDQNNNSQVNSDFSISPKRWKQEELDTILEPEELHSSKIDEPSRRLCSSDVTSVKNKTSGKLTSCVAAIDVHSTENNEVFNCLEVEIEPILGRQEDDNDRIELLESITSEESSKCSVPVSNPVIPKVCIKTIKTKTGQIKRTVTRISSKHKGVEKSGTTIASFSSPKPSTPTIHVSNSVGFANDVPKQMTMKPVATAFLPVSAVKTVGSQVISLMLSDNTTVKATVIPASPMPSTKSIQQQAVMVPASNGAKLVPKTVHLGNLNLLPKAMPLSSSDHQRVYSSSQKRQSQQQLKSTLHRRMSKKASNVQVSGSSQSSLVDAFNKVFSSINPVPVYVPDLSPPSATDIALPPRGYRCLECGDSFALEKSLAQHRERRSVRIDLTCNHCDKSLVFYNKCSLLSHARSHKGKIMQCSNLTLKPIPTNQMITTTSPVGIHSTTSAFHSKRVKRDQQAAALSSSGNAESLEETSKLEIFKCWECNEMFEDVYSLAVHYKQESNSQKTCSVCQMILPNKCSFLSHERIHLQKPPYVCPECGAKFQSVYLQSHHVNKNCLHYTRRSGYRCVHCSVICTDASSLKSHIQSSHCEIFYKCPVCPMAFKSAPGTHSHAFTQHSGVKAGEPKLIYKCALCDTVFTLPSLLYTHLEQHVNTHRVPVYKCPHCSMYYAQKQLMLDHIKVTHGTLKTPEGPASLPLITRSSNSNRSSANSNHESGNGRPDRRANGDGEKGLKSAPNSGYTCGECHVVSASRETYVAHVRKKHGKILKKHPCHHCEKSFCSMDSLCRHNRLKHKGLHRDLVITQCPPLSQPFTKRVLLNQHIQLMHGDAEGESASTNAAMATVSDEEMTSPKQKSEEREGSPDVNCRGSDSGPLKKFKVNVLKVCKCAVCGFNTENRTTFHEHIPRHKPDCSSHQCNECGLCYTSPRSLSRHLFIVHRLKEPRGLGQGHGQGKGVDESQRENQLNSEEEEDDGSPKTRCKVCGREFETEGMLNTHMRTHGMAFIKAKASRLNAEKR